MKIAICGSNAFAEEMVATQCKLNALGHQAFVSRFVAQYLGKRASEIEALTIQHKNEQDAIREYWEVIGQCDAILVLNYDRRGIANYIGGNSLMEIGFAHVLGKSIYLLNPIPDIEFYRSEIVATNPVILHGNFDQIPR